MNPGEIVRLASRGDGVTAGGQHVSLAAPGDVVEADGTLRRGQHHATPPCRHFPECGGCQLQHVDDTAYAGFITDRIKGALLAQGLDVPHIRPAHLSPPRTRRRVAMRVERRGRRVLLGFNEERSHRIIDIRQCEIMRPELYALVDPLRALLGDLLQDRRAAAIQMTMTDQGADLLIEKVVADGLHAAEALTSFAMSHRLARVSIDAGYGTETRWEPEPVTVTLGGVAVPFPPGSFLQATADGEAALVGAVREAVGSATHIADLFAGLGTFGFAAEGHVTAVEGSRDALLAMKAGAARAGKHLRAEHRDLFRRPLSAAELGAFDAVILDPPRAGAKEQAEQLARARTSRLAYVSCNPATFARDAKLLCDAGWQILWIQPVGQFRWSTHVELAAAFARAGDIKV